MTIEPDSYPLVKLASEYPTELHDLIHAAVEYGIAFDRFLQCSPYNLDKLLRLETELTYREGVLKDTAHDLQEVSGVKSDGLASYLDIGDKHGN